MRCIETSPPQKGVCKLQNNNTTKDYESQVVHIMHQLAQKRGYNRNVIAWLRSEHDDKAADDITNCAHNIGVISDNGIAKIVRADFCRRRICAICAWRRQAKFRAQMIPVLDYLSTKGYTYIMATLTVRNVPYWQLSNAVDMMMTAYDRLCKRRKISRVWSGRMRSLEVTYNAEMDTYHPHIHMMVAVTDDYYHNPDNYITQSQLVEMWRDVLDVDYYPSVDLRPITDNIGGALEVIKYALKPSQSTKALSALHYALKGRRLVSFGGIIAQTRRDMRMSDLDNLLDDTSRRLSGRTYDLYKWDVTGGVYRLYDTYIL